MGSAANNGKMLEMVEIGCGFCAPLLGMQSSAGLPCHMSGYLGKALPEHELLHSVFHVILSYTSFPAFCFPWLSTSLKERA